MFLSSYKSREVHLTFIHPDPCCSLGFYFTSEKCYLNTITGFRLYNLMQKSVSPTIESMIGNITVITTILYRAFHVALTLERNVHKFKSFKIFAKLSSPASDLMSQIVVLQIISYFDCFDLQPALLLGKVKALRWIF